MKAAAATPANSSKESVTSLPAPSNEPFLPDLPGYIPPGENETDANQFGAEVPPAVPSPPQTDTALATNFSSTDHNKEAKDSLSLVSVGSCCCRICHANSCKDRLVSPCHCKGSLAYVHKTCLERWLTQAGKHHCEVCLYNYTVEMTRRYGFLEALRVWIRLPRNRGLLQSDLLICSLFTIVTLGLIAVFLVGARLFVLGGLKLGISQIWTHGAISFSLTILVVAYVINLYLIIKGQFSPWLLWWRSNVNIRVVLDEDVQNQYVCRTPYQQTSV